MFVLIIGIVLLVTSVVFFFEWQKTTKKVQALKDTDTSSVAQLSEMSHTIAQEIGSVGAFKEQVEVKGSINCSNPIIAELSQRPCVYAKMQVVEKYEETYYTQDEKGKPQKRTRPGSTTLANNTLQVNFQLDDGTGKIHINPHGAEIEALEVVNRYELAQNHPSSLSFGGFHWDVPVSNSNDKRILGYQYNEWILPVESKIYVLGEITDSDGHLVIHQPLNKNNRFLITYKSKEELLHSKIAQMTSQKTVMTICGIIGLICTIVGSVIK
jgi:hypothetical protein